MLVPLLFIALVLYGVWHAVFRTDKAEIHGHVSGSLWVTCSWSDDVEVRRCGGLYERKLKRWEGKDVWEKEGKHRRWLLFDGSCWRVVAELGQSPIACSEHGAKNPEGVWTVKGTDFIVSRMSTLLGFQVGELVTTNKDLSPTVPEGTPGRIIGGNRYHLKVSFNGTPTSTSPCTLDRSTGPSVSVLCTDLVWRYGTVISTHGPMVKIKYEDPGQDPEWIHMESARLLEDHVSCTLHDNVILSHLGPKDRCLQSRGEVGKIIKDLGPFVKYSFKVRAPSGETSMYTRTDLLPIEHDTGLLQMQVLKEYTFDESTEIRKAAELRETISKQRLESSFEVLTDEILEEVDKVLGVLETPHEPALVQPSFCSIPSGVLSPISPVFCSVGYSHSTFFDSPPSVEELKMQRKVKRESLTLMLGKPVVPLGETYRKADTAASGLGSIINLLEDEILDMDTAKEDEQDEDENTEGTGPFNLLDPVEMPSLIKEVGEVTPMDDVKLLPMEEPCELDLDNDGEWQRETVALVDNVTPRKGDEKEVDTHKDVADDISDSSASAKGTILNLLEDRGSECSKSKWEMPDGSARSDNSSCVSGTSLSIIRATPLRRGIRSPKTLLYQSPAAKAIDPKKVLSPVRSSIVVHPPVDKKAAFAKKREKQLRNIKAVHPVLPVPPPGIKEIRVAKVASPRSDLLFSENS
eukprot:TRINITY_DN23966_c0_g3_i2.p1 TRINITY_DN23966_c0_g3~~TRINITY_DN23966_c0_g3_i2.p1  ORF type:complete len:691 (+),score=209.16 TRINITY_DN23966_c0_g3_i2:298-2370(+)